MDPFFLRHNERLKLAAATAGGGGTALLGYALGQWSDYHQEAVTVVSFFISFLLFYAAYLALGELETEQ